MPDYKKMYYVAFNAMTDAELAIDSKEFNKAKKILENARLSVEIESLIDEDADEDEVLF